MKLLSDRLYKGVNPRTGKEIEYIEYMLEEDGTKKVYSSKMRDDSGGLSYFVQRMSEFEEGETVIMEMKKSGAKNYISVDRITSSSDVEVDGDDEYPEDTINYDDPAGVPFAEAE